MTMSGRCLAQRAGQGQGVGQPGGVAGEGDQTPDQMGLLRGEAEKLPGLPPQFGRIHDDGVFPPLQQMQQVQAPRPAVHRRHAVGQPPAEEFRHHPGAHPIVPSQGVAQAEDQAAPVVHRDHYSVKADFSVWPDLRNTLLAGYVGL
jgi:hypothetical protein